MEVIMFKATTIEPDYFVRLQRLPPTIQDQILGKIREADATLVQYLLDKEAEYELSWLATISNDDMATKTMAIVCHVFGVSKQDIKGPARTAHLVDARRCFTLMMSEIQTSYSEIGRLLGNRDHSTIMTQHRTGKDYLIIDPKFRQRHDQVKQLLAKYIILQENAQ